MGGGSRRSAWWRGAVGACTEGLGSDSGDVGGADLDDQLLPAAEAEADEGADGGALDEPLPPLPEEEEEKKSRVLPPVMPRASEALVMRAERRGGRLILTEVRAAGRQRRGVFRASRDGGRLQLCFFATNASADAVAAYAPDGGEPNNDNNNQQQEQEQEAAPYGGEPCQVAAAGAAGPRVEVGAVVGM